MNKAGNWVAASWLNVLLITIVCVCMIGLLTLKLHTLVPGLSSEELVQARSSSSTAAIIDNPVGLPHKAIQYGSQRLQNSIFSIRAASVFIGVVVISSFYYIVSRWYTRRVALLGTLLFASSAWFLHVSRYGGNQSMYMLLCTAVACALWLQQSRGSTLAVLASAAVVIMLLYIPGMIWFVIPAIFWQFQRISETLEGQNAVVLTLISILFLCLLAPLGWSLYQEPDLVRAYFGLPETTPSAIQAAKNFVSVPYQILFKGAENPQLWLGRIPLLGIMPSAMFIIGIYSFIQKRKLDRVTFISLAMIFGSILVAIGGPVSIAVLLPFIFLVATGGIGYMLQQWYKVFPYNPFARLTGLILFTVVVFLSIYGGVRQYFVAWSQAPETKQVFTKHP